MNILNKLSKRAVNKAVKKTYKKAFAESGRCVAVVLAAGSSSRFGQEDKLFSNLWDKPVLAHSLLAFQNCDAVHEIIVVTREESIMKVAELCKYHGITKVSKIIRGGDTRQQSSLLGVNEVPADSRVIAIHDGARPMVTDEIIRQAIHTARHNMAAVPSVPMKDTVKICEGTTVASTPDRSTLRAVQTPQVFISELIKGALTAAENCGVQYTDDCAAAEAFGVKVILTEGSEENIKVTTPMDLALANAIMERRFCL